MFTFHSYHVRHRHICLSDISISPISKFRPCSIVNSLISNKLTLFKRGNCAKIRNAKVGEGLGVATSPEFLKGYKEGG